MKKSKLVQSALMDKYDCYCSPTFNLQLQERLKALDSNNQSILDTIETSLFVLVLDENDPVTKTEVNF